MQSCPPRCCTCVELNQPALDRTHALHLLQIRDLLKKRERTAYKIHMGPVDHSGAYTAAVSGASGFIGTELVKQLLEKGYNVKGNVRDTSNTEKTAHLTKLAEVGCLMHACVLHTICMIHGQLCHAA